MKTTKPNTLPALQTTKESKPSTTLPALGTGRQPPQRTVTQVRDLRNGGDSLVPVAAVLDPLGAAGFSKLRVDTAAAHAAGEALFRCGECNAPVHPRIRRDGSGGDGRDGYMAHYPGAKECPWHTGDAVHNPGGAMLAGQQEGSQHQQLKALLAQCLSQDPGFTDIAVEQRITSDAGWRTPDVSAVYHGKSIAFEVQLMRPLLGTLAERDAFYAGIGMHLVWVTAEQILQQPMTQAFRDLILSSGGRIFVLTMSLPIDRSGARPSTCGNTPSSLPWWRVIRCSTAGGKMWSQWRWSSWTRTSAPSRVRLGTGSSSVLSCERRRRT